MAQQTAVEWLASEINSRGPKENNPPQWLQELYDKAKEIEKEQIEAAWKRGDGEHDKVADELAKQYYTQNYGTRLQNETN
jgi:transcriptional regulator with PAS, ATPase and Fis domain